LDRGLSVPAYVQNLTLPGLSGNVVKQEDSVPLPKHFTVHKTVHEIQYNPEASLEEGLGMVKTIKETLKHLELGSKLREEVWDREIASFV